MVINTVTTMKVFKKACMAIKDADRHPWGRSEVGP